MQFPLNEDSFDRMYPHENAQDEVNFEHVQPKKEKANFLKKSQILPKLQIEKAKSNIMSSKSYRI